jgi:hypothetical protein
MLAVFLVYVDRDGGVHGGALKKQMGRVESRCRGFILFERITFSDFAGRCAIGQGEITYQWY